MKNYVVVDNDGSDHYIVGDLNELIKEMYEVDLDNGVDFETVKGWFHNNFIVFESNSEIKEVVHG